MKAQALLIKPQTILKAEHPPRRPVQLFCEGCLRKDKVHGLCFRLFAKDSFVPARAKPAERALEVEERDTYRHISEFAFAKVSPPSFAFKVVRQGPRGVEAL